MDHWLFKSVVTSSLLYQNFQLSKIKDSTAEIERILANAANESAYRDFLKEKIYSLRKGVQAALLRVSENAHQAYFFARTARRFLDESPISTASFSEISEKEYFDKTRDLIDELEQNSSALLPDDQTEAVRAYITAMRCVDALGDYVNAKEARDFYARMMRHPSLSYLLTEERSSTEPKIGCYGYGGLGCLSLIFVGIVMSVIMDALPEELSSTLSSSGLAGLAGAVLVVGAFGLIICVIDWVSNKWKREREERGRKRKEQALSALDTYLDMTGQRTVYENLKFRTDSSAYFAAAAAAEKLRVCGFNIDRSRSLDELKQELAFHREVIKSCGPVIDPSLG